MLNFARYFLRGTNNTLRLQNGVNFSYSGPWIPLYAADTLMDEWYLGDYMAAEYTIVVDSGSQRKEMIKAMVVASSYNASVTVFGRTNLNENLIDISATVDQSKVRIIVNPASSPDGSTYDNSSLFLGGKIIYSATYYSTIGD